MTELHLIALQEISRIVGNESALNGADAAALRGVLFAALSEQHGVPASHDLALRLIGTVCANYVGGSDCVSAGRGSPYARYGADRWCDQCIARTALEGRAFPARYASGVEELPDPGLYTEVDEP